MTHRVNIPGRQTPVGQGCPTYQFSRRAGMPDLPYESRVGVTRRVTTLGHRTPVGQGCPTCFLKSNRDFAELPATTLSGRMLLPIVISVLAQKASQEQTRAALQVATPGPSQRCIPRRCNPGCAIHRDNLRWKPSHQPSGHQAEMKVDLA